MAVCFMVDIFITWEENNKSIEDILRKLALAFPLVGLFHNLILCFNLQS